jgi:hypothetical protein
MPNPAPIYKVSYNGQELPGYVQSDDRPLSFNAAVHKPIGRDGANRSKTSSGRRDISLTFLLKSSLGLGATGLQHLDNVMDQYRSALAIITRAGDDSPLVIHDTDRYYEASIDSVSMPMNAQQSRSIQYSATFSAQPWAIATTPQTASFSGNGTVNIAGMLGSRTTYPLLVVPNTVTDFTATDTHGHVLTFKRYTSSVNITVDCGKMRAYRTSTGQSLMYTMESLNFGLVYDPSDGNTFSLTITGFSGSGSVTVNIPKRYEL